MSIGLNDTGPFPTTHPSPKEDGTIAVLDPVQPTGMGVIFCPAATFPGHGLLPLSSWTDYRTSQLRNER